MSRTKVNAFKQRYCPRCWSYYHKGLRRDHVSCEDKKYSLPVRRSSGSAYDTYNDGCIDQGSWNGFLH